MINNKTKLLICRWITTFGLVLQNIALPLVIYKETQSTSLLSLIFVFETLPWLIVAPLISEKSTNLFSIKNLYIMCDICRALLTGLLILFIDTPILVVMIFFFLGVFNSLMATYNSILIKNFSNEKSLQAFVGIAMGVDDAISIVAPFIITLAASFMIDYRVFIAVNAICLVIASVIAGTMDNTNVIEKKIKSKNNMMISYQDLFRGKIGFLVVSECLRSLMEGLCIPLFVSYVMEELLAPERIYTIGEMLNSIAQVVMSFIYIIIMNKKGAKFVINAGAILIFFALGGLVLNINCEGYLALMIIFGAGTSIRQLVGENVFIKKYDVEDLSTKLANFNSLVAMCYVVGYTMSFFAPSVMSSKMVMFLGGLIVILPTIYDYINGIFKREKEWI